VSGTAPLIIVNQGGGCRMSVPKFEIFRGRFPETDVLWLECVDGLAASVDRMKAIAAQKPGPYFVFNAQCHEVLASIDTTPKSKSQVA
jgi:hypothetical protein